MADFSIIADISSGLIKLLREKTCPEPVPSPESIKLASPAEKNADFQLGLFLYDVKELSEYRTSGPIRSIDNTRRNPPKPLTLHYVLYINSKAQISAGAETEQRILGRCMQALADDPLMDVTVLHPVDDKETETAAITLVNQTFEEKSKLWSALNVPYQLGIFFTVSPVLLSSRKSEQIVRVREVEFGTNTIAPR